MSSARTRSACIRSVDSGAIQPPTPSTTTHIGLGAQALVRIEDRLERDRRCQRRAPASSGASGVFERERIDVFVRHGVGRRPAATPTRLRCATHRRCARNRSPAASCPTARTPASRIACSNAVLASVLPTPVSVPVTNNTVHAAAPAGAPRSRRARYAHNIRPIAEYSHIGNPTVKLFNHATGAASMTEARHHAAGRRRPVIMRTHRLSLCVFVALGRIECERVRASQRMHVHSPQQPRQRAEAHP